jgi:hypothetical protein
VEDEAPDRPLLAVLHPLAVSPGPDLGVDAASGGRPALNRARAGFREFSAGLGQPDWSEAETLAHLSEPCLLAEDQRRARGPVDEALSLVPDRRFARAVMNKVSSRY